MSVHKLVLLRHGESVWNKANRFTGWVDVDLTEKGEAEAKAAGQLLKEKEFVFDQVYTSVLKRAIRTMNFVLEQTDQLWLPVAKEWRLNERHYGALQGLNKSETTEKYGEEQVFTWRRSYATPPPEMDKNDEGHPANDRRYKSVSASDLPSCEALKQTKERVMPFWEDVILPKILSGSRVMIVAHGNSLRALIQHLDNVSEEEISKLNIPTGQPLVYELDEKGQALKHYYLGDADKIAEQARQVAEQAKAK